MPLRQRQEVQKVLRRLTRRLPRPASAKLISVAFAHILPVPANSIWEKPSATEAKIAAAYNSGPSQALEALLAAG
jgi:hypothetical protein